MSDSPDAAKTPRTDEFIDKQLLDLRGCDLTFETIASVRAWMIAYSTFARTLERELQQARAELAEERETVRAHCEEIFRLQAEAAANAKDAERYRWLRSNISHAVDTMYGEVEHYFHEEEVDEVCDDALSAAGRAQNG